MTEQQKRNLAAACALGGIMFVGYGTWGTFKAWPTGRWPTTTGTVVTSRVTPVADGPDVADIVYRYSVNGVSYSGSRIGYMRLSTERGARMFVAGHPEGSSVDVYYNPTDPAKAVLGRGGERAGLGFAAAGGLLILASRLVGRRKAR